MHFFQRGTWLTLVSMGSKPDRVRITFSQFKLNGNRSMFPSTGVEVRQVRRNGIIINQDLGFACCGIVDIVVERVPFKRARAGDIVEDDLAPRRD